MKRMYPMGEVACHIIGVTGPVGCGKSTLAHLLLRRYDPPRGTLLIDGRDALDWPTAALRRQVGIIDQEPFLFSDSIAANILFGVEGADSALHAGWRALPQATQDRMLSAARVANVEDEIRAFLREIVLISFESLLPLLLRTHALVDGFAEAIHRFLREIELVHGRPA